LEKKDDDDKRKLELRNIDSSSSDDQRDETPKQEPKPIPETNKDTSENPIYVPDSGDISFKGE